MALHSNQTTNRSSCSKNLTAPAEMLETVKSGENGEAEAEVCAETLLEEEVMLLLLLGVVSLFLKIKLSKSKAVLEIWRAGIFDGQVLSKCCQVGGKV